MNTIVFFLKLYKKSVNKKNTTLTQSKRSLLSTHFSESVLSCVLSCNDVFTQKLNFAFNNTL